MIRQALTSLFCAALFFLIAFVIPVRAEHPFTTNFVCLTEEAGMVAVRLSEAGAMDKLIQKAKKDKEFQCYWVKLGYAYMAIEIVHTYMAVGVRKVMVLSIDGKGREVYTFGSDTFVRKLLHFSGERGA